MLFVVFLMARRLINSPFGLALRGIRENFVRMPAIGAPSRAHIRMIYTIAAAIAGVAGAVIAQTTSTVSLEALSFERSADVVVMLVLGGAGRLYGGLIGSAIFLIARDQFSGIAPQYWYFWIGLLLVTVVLLSAERNSRRPLAPYLRDGGASEHARSVHARPCQNVRLAGGRPRHRSHAAGRRPLRADRAEWRRQDHADQSDDRNAFTQ